MDPTNSSIIARWLFVQTHSILSLSPKKFQIELVRNILQDVSLIHSPILHPILEMSSSFYDTLHFFLWKQPLLHEIFQLGDHTFHVLVDDICHDNDVATVMVAMLMVTSMSLVMVLLLSRERSIIQEGTFFVLQRKIYLYDNRTDYFSSQQKRWIRAHKADDFSVVRKPVKIQRNGRILYVLYNLILQ